MARTGRARFACRRLDRPLATLCRTDRSCAIPGKRVRGATGPPFAQADGSAERWGVDFCKSFDTFVPQLIFDGTKLLVEEKRCSWAQETAHTLPCRSCSLSFFHSLQCGGRRGLNGPAPASKRRLICRPRSNRESTKSDRITGSMRSRPTRRRLNFGRRAASSSTGCVGPRSISASSGGTTTPALRTACSACRGTPRSSSLTT